MGAVCRSFLSDKYLNSGFIASTTEAREDYVVALGGLVVSVLTIGPKARGFKP